MSLALDPRTVAIAARKGLELARADPLRWRRLACLGQRKLFEFVAQGIEVHAHAGSNASKTSGGVDLMLRLARGQRKADGRLLVRPGTEPDALSDTPHWIALPEIPQPSRWWILVESYDQAKDASMLALKQLLGDWPHRTSWLDAARGLPKSVRVRWDGCRSDDPNDWSEITFVSQEGLSQEDARKIAGGRINGAMGDEAPMEAMWRELRARAMAGQRLYRWVCETPKFKPRWAWLRDDFRGCHEVPRGGKVDLQWSVEDNRALSWAEIEQRRQDWRSDDLFDAMWNGDYVDISGRCPFPRKALERLLAASRHGRFEQIQVREATEFEPAAWAWVERWYPPEHGHFYVGVIDASRGIDSPDHDPGELDILDWTDPKLVCRFGMVNGKGGYLDGDALGVLGNIEGRRYHDARLEIETNGGFGEPVLLALRRLGYPNIGHLDKASAPGEFQRSYGFASTPATISEAIAAIQRGLSDPAAAFECRSPDVIQQLMDVVERADGRSPDVRPGVRHHREAMICLGRALHLAQTHAPPTFHERRTETSLAKALRQDFGRDVIRPKAHARPRHGFPEFG